jgi:hypothetical protein
MASLMHLTTLKNINLNKLQIKFHNIKNKDISFKITVQAYIYQKNFINMLISYKIFKTRKNRNEKKVKF